MLGVLVAICTPFRLVDLSLYSMLATLLTVASRYKLGGL